MKEGDILENVLDSENTGGPSYLETPGGDQKEMGENSINGSELDNKKIDNHETKTKLCSDRNDVHSSGFFDTFLSDENIDGKESQEKREMRKAEGALLTNSEKMSNRRRALKKTPKEYRTEAPKRKSEGVELTNSEKKMFKEAFNTDKARLAKRQVKLVQQGS